MKQIGQRDMGRTPSDKSTVLSFPSQGRIAFLSRRRRKATLNLKEVGFEIHGTQGTQSCLENGSGGSIVIMGEDVSCRLLVWLEDGHLAAGLPIRETQGHCLCNHRLSDVLPVDPRCTAREPAKQNMSVGIALGAHGMVPREKKLLL